MINNPLIEFFSRTYSVIIEIIGRNYVTIVQFIINNAAEILAVFFLLKIVSNFLIVWYAIQYSVV